MRGPTLGLSRCSVPASRPLLAQREVVGGGQWTPGFGGNGWGSGPLVMYAADVLRKYDPALTLER